jgi:mannosyltransferase
VLDELSTLAFAAADLGTLRQALAVDANMTMYYWGMFLWVRLVGVGADEALLRLPSAVVGAAAVPLVFVLGRRLHSTAAGLAAAVLLALNSYHIAMSQEARAYSAFASFTVLSFLLLIEALEGNRRRYWLMHGFVNALTFYLHFYAGFTIIGQALIVLSRRSRSAVVGLLGSGVVTAVLLGQLVPYFLRRSQFGVFPRLSPPGFDDLFRVLTDFSGNPGLLAMTMALGTLSLTMKGERCRGWLLWAWLLVPLGLTFGVSQLRPIFSERYLFAALPSLPLLAGIGLARLPRLTGLVTLTAMVGLSIGAIQNGVEARRGEQWRQAVSYATSQAKPGDGWIFISKWGQNAFKYYAGWAWGQNPSAPYSDVLEPFQWSEALKVRKYRELSSISALEDFAPGHARIWLVLSHEFDPVRGDTAAPVRDWLSRHSYAATQRQLRSVRVILYQRLAAVNPGGLGHSHSAPSLTRPAKAGEKESAV